MVLALLTCLTISRGFSFCSYYSGRQLQCAPYTHTGPVEARLSLLLQVLINPVYFPLTVTAVLPIMITLASHHSLFPRPEAAPLPRPGWLQAAGLAHVHGGVQPVPDGPDPVRAGRARGA